MYPAACNPFYNLPTTKRYLTMHGDGDAKIWITEFGYTTSALTPRKQGERLREALGQVVKWELGGADVRVRLDGLPQGGLRRRLRLGSQRPLRQPQGVALILRSYVRAGAG